MSEAFAPPPSGWYYREDDPPGTMRFWDGERWQGEAQPKADAAIPGGYVLSSVALRIGARVLDGCIALLVMFVLGIIGLALGGGVRFEGDVPAELADQGRFDLTHAVLLASAAISLVWDALFVSILGGTPGKLLFGMRVIHATNGRTPPGLKKSFLRASNRLLLAVAPYVGVLLLILRLLLGLVSLVFLFTDDRNRTVMDLIAGTLVVDKSVEATPMTEG